MPFQFLVSIFLGIAAISCHAVLQQSKCYNGHSYALSNGNMSWERARSYCIDYRAGQLSTVDDEDEQQFLLKAFNKKIFWIGLNDINDEGNFTWTDGSTSQYRNWRDNNPDNDGSCVRFTKSGKWINIGCDISRKFVCEEVSPPPGEWFTCDDSQWRLFPTIPTWRAAELTCQEQGGHLANMGQPTNGKCARRVLRTCLNSSDAPVQVAFNGFHDLFNAGIFVWSSNNGRFDAPPELPAHTICGGFSDTTMEGLFCNASYPFVCERPLPNATNPFSTSCNNVTYTYNPLAFSWEEADIACRSTDSVLLDPSSLAECSCVGQMFSQNVFSHGSAVSNISMWVRCQSGLCGAGQCPMWRYDTGNRSIDMLACEIARPYICVHDTMDDCAVEPCLNGGNCMDEVNGFRCICPPALTGDVCDQVVNCSSCLNGATCQSGSTANCTCTSGFTGPFCEPGVLPIPGSPFYNASCQYDVTVRELLSLGSPWTRQASYVNVRPETNIRETGESGQFSFITEVTCPGTQDDVFPVQSVVFQNYQSVFGTWTKDLLNNLGMVFTYRMSFFDVNVSSILTLPLVFPAANPIFLRARQHIQTCTDEDVLCDEWQELAFSSTNMPQLRHSGTPIELEFIVRYSKSGDALGRRKRETTEKEYSVPFRIMNPSAIPATPTTAPTSSTSSTSSIPTSFGAATDSLTTPTSSAATPGQPNAEESNDGSSSSTSAIIGAVIGVSLAAGAALLLFLIWRRRKNNKKIALLGGRRGRTAGFSNPAYTNQTSNGQSQWNSSQRIHVPTAELSVQPTTADEYENVMFSGSGKEVAYEEYKERKQTMNASLPGDAVQYGLDNLAPSHEAIPADQSIIYSEAQAPWTDGIPPPLSQGDASFTAGTSNVYEALPPSHGGSTVTTSHLGDMPKSGADPAYYILEREGSAERKGGRGGTLEQPLLSEYNTLERDGRCRNAPIDDVHASVNTAGGAVYENTLQEGVYSMLDDDSIAGSATAQQPEQTPATTLAKQPTLTSQGSQRSWTFEPDADGVLYEAVSPRPMHQRSASAEESFSGGGTNDASVDILYDSILMEPNEQPYQEPPHEEAEVFAVLRRPIYRHIHRSELDLQEQIGSGNFGVVMKSSWKLDGRELPAAVKMLREGAENAQKVEFLKEAIVMGQFYHRNVVTMFGVVDDSEPCMLVLELMNTALRPHLFGLKNRNSKSVVTLLHRFCVDIAAGMAYLASREFVHRDLAARNILLDRNRTCKIADFGLSRNLDGGDYYISQSTGPIPVKWTAPEALNFHRYSTKSDVWSFGIVLYEVFAFGRKPYFGMTNEKVLTMVREGYRMEKAPRCPEDLYGLQQRCWNDDPHHRPQFSEILQILTQMYGRLGPRKE